MAGGDAILAVDDPATSGDDDALLDDMLIGDNNPTDVCIWFENVPAGNYEVILYAMTPGDPAHQNRLRVDFGSPGPIMCGGAWAGFHQDSVTFVRFQVFPELGGARMGIFDAAGRLVRSLPAAMPGSGPCRVLWDGRDSQARPVSAAVYYVRVLDERTKAAVERPAARIVRR